ncbi:25093_t:CDS:2 [Gigaspora margarita]|uniref:25093_t:CDS:1 n=1 Tax=Gigaspora margarita TaxID=4874 RepID=A0ABM8W6C1_GIGMA|nr:25093_t:CDS:2 [Gigaspora margarita]
MSLKNILQNGFAIETQSDAPEEIKNSLRFEVPLKKENNIVYFPYLVNPPKTNNSQTSITECNSYMEDESALENLIVTETANFLDHLANEKRPDPKFYAITRLGTTPGLFGAGVSNPPENIQKIFKGNSINNQQPVEIISNQTNKTTKPRARKNVNSSTKTKSKKSIKLEDKQTINSEHDMSIDEEPVKETVKNHLKVTESKPKKRALKTKLSETSKISNKESASLEVQRLIQKHKRRKERKRIKDGTNNISRNSLTPIIESSVAKSESSTGVTPLAIFTV